MGTIWQNLEMDEKLSAVQAVAEYKSLFSTLYRAIVEHRRKFYHLKYVDYDKDYPQYISFVPTGKLADDFRKDYEENMVRSYIYGNAISFEELIRRLEVLQERFRGINM